MKGTVVESACQSCVEINGQTRLLTTQRQQHNGHTTHALAPRVQEEMSELM